VAEGPCPACGLSGAIAWARHGDVSPWATRVLSGRPGRFRAFVANLMIVLRLDRRHLRRWGRLPLADGRRSSRFAVVIGLWVLVNAIVAYELFAAPPGALSASAGFTLLTTHVILLPLSLLIVTGVVLIQAGVLSWVARRLGRSLRVRTSAWTDRDDPVGLVDEAENLTCPECDYSLTGLPSETCPECGLEGAVTLARRGHFVEEDQNIWPLIAYGTGCWVPALVLLDLLVVLIGLVGTVLGPEAADDWLMNGRWVLAAILLAGGIWWVVFQVVALERSMGRPLSVGQNLAVVAALALSIGPGVKLMLYYLSAVRGLVT